MRHWLIGAALVIFTAARAFGVDTFIYGKHDTGMYGNYGPDGFVGPDGISRVICYSIDPAARTNTAYIYRVTVPDGTDPETHPDNPSAPGPVAPRTLVLEHSFPLRFDGFQHSEFYVADMGKSVYFGPAYGIRKFVFDGSSGTYQDQGLVAPPAPGGNGRLAGTLAYDKRTNTWYAGTISFNLVPGVTPRYIWKYHGNQGPEGQWELAFTYYTSPFPYNRHDGLEMVNGLLYLADNVGAVIYEYTTEGTLLRTYVRGELYNGGEGVDYAGMGYGALQHFWYGSPSTFLVEFGGGVLERHVVNNPPVAVAGAPLTVSTDQAAKTIIDGSVTDPDGGVLLCRWLQEGQVLQNWTPVAANGACPLVLALLPTFPAGSHQLTIEGMDDTGATDSDQTALTVFAPRHPAILDVAVTPDNGSFTQGSRVSYKVVVRNAAQPEALAAENVKLEGDFPTSHGITWSDVSTTQGACTIADNRLQCSLGSIPAGHSVTVTVSTSSGTPAAACQQQPFSSAQATAKGGLTAYDSGSLTCTVPKPAIEVVKTANVATAAPGQQVTYSYTVKNAGNVTVADISVKDDNGTPHLLTDDFLVGSIGSLEPGEQMTMTAATIPSDTSIVARLGGGGPSLFTVLSLGGDPPLDDSGIYCAAATVNGNVGIVGKGYFHNAARCSESGDFYKGGQVDYLDLGGQLKGRIIVDDPFLYEVRAQVLKTSQYFASLPITPEVQAQFPADGKLDRPLTVTGKPGMNVVRLPVLGLSKGYLTLTGPPGTQFLLNINGTFNMNTGNISRGGGVGPFDVVFNITNPKASVGVGRGFSGMVGILLAPYNEIHAIYNKVWDGQIIGGYNRGPIKLNYDTVVTATDPPPPTVTNTATASGRYGAETVTATAQATVLIK